MTERGGDVAIVTLDRPDAMNAIDLEFVRGLLGALDEVDGSEARALVLTGADGVFCAGADLGIIRAAFDDDLGVALEPIVDTLHAVIRRLRALPVPTIAAVEGPAVGAGLGLALAADLLVVGRSARLVPAYMRIGASPDGGVSWLLARALGGARAASAMLRNATISSDEALALGLAEAVVDDGEALARATELASKTNVSPRALLALRELTDLATANTLDRHLDLERDRIAGLWSGHDFAEGVAAFLEKRQPTFTGR